MDNKQNENEFFEERKLASNDNFELLCCGSQHPDIRPSFQTEKTWVTAAELVHKLTGQSGTVVDDLITFILKDSTKIDISLLGGFYLVYTEGNKEAVNSGRKALQLLMYLNNLSFEDALKWFNENYGIVITENLANDYVKMKIDELR